MIDSKHIHLSETMDDNLNYLSKFKLENYNQKYDRRKKKALDNVSSGTLQTLWEVFNVRQDVLFLEKRCKQNLFDEH